MRAVAAAAANKSNTKDPHLRNHPIPPHLSRKKPLHSLAQQLTSAPCQVFFYQWNHTWPDAACSDLYFFSDYGVTHTAEIPYVFGMPTYVFGQPASPQNCRLSTRDKEFALGIGKLWTSLVAHPGEGLDGFRMPAYKPTADLATVLQPTPRNQFRIESGWRRSFC